MTSATAARAAIASSNNLATEHRQWLATYDDRLTALLPALRFVTKHKTSSGFTKSGSNPASKRIAALSAIRRHALGQFATPVLPWTQAQHAAFETAFAALEQNPALLETYIATERTLRFQAGDGL